MRWILLETTGPLILSFAALALPAQVGPVKQKVTEKTLKGRATETLLETQGVLLLENERVKVWKRVIEPTERRAQRHSNRARVEVALDKGVLTVTEASGEVRRDKWKKGEVRWRERDSLEKRGSHVAADKRAMEFIIVEIKEPTDLAARPPVHPAPVPAIDSSSWRGNLGEGPGCSVQGSVTDSVGRPADATIFVSGPGGTIGYVKTTAGRFVVCGLARGAYPATVRSARDGSISRGSITVGPGITRVALRVR